MFIAQKRERSAFIPDADLFKRGKEMANNEYIMENGK